MADETPQIEQNPPVWVVSVLANMQATEDKRYASVLEAYKAAAAGWIDNANKDHALGISVPPFNYVMPSKVIYHPQVGGGWFQTTWQDPTVQPPVEPPNTVTAPGPNPFKTEAPAQDAANQAMQAAMYNLLVKIAAKMQVS